MTFCFFWRGKKHRRGGVPDAFFVCGEVGVDKVWFVE
jgi:hypothetical protein